MTAANGFIAAAATVGESGEQLMEVGDQDLEIQDIRNQLAQRASLAKGVAMSWPEICAAMDAATANIPLSLRIPEQSFK